MKIEKNRQYFNIAVYVVLTWIVLLIVSSFLLHIRESLGVITSILGYLYMLLEPLIVGLVIAYLMDPLVDFYESRCQTLSFSDLFHLKKRPKKKSKQKRWPMRTVPTLLAFITLLLIVGLFVLLIIMNIEQVAGSFSVSRFRESILSYLDYFEEMLQAFSVTAQGLGLSPQQGDLVEQIYGKINAFTQDFYRQILGSLSIWGLHMMNWLLALVIAFYLLQDSRRLWTVWGRLSSKILGKRYQSVHLLLKKIDCAVSGYIRGEILDSIIMTILTSVALTLIQLDFAIIIGIISGIFNLIPYFGPIVGFALAVIIGLLDPNPIKAVYGAAAIIIIQQIDGWFIVPKIVGECVRLHPVIVLLVILIGGNLFGLVGMLLAVPVTAVIRILLIYYLPDYFEETEG